MGVYINGMEMPKDCLKCPFCLFADGYWKCLVDGSHADFGGTCRPSLCPLVSVPPHGRLIDANAVLEAVEYDDRTNLIEFVHIRSILDEVPTVIPADTAEEGEQ